MHRITAPSPPQHTRPLPNPTSHIDGALVGGMQQDRVTLYCLDPRAPPPHHLQTGVFDRGEEGQAWTPRGAVRMQVKQVGGSEKKLELSKINLDTRPCSQQS